MKKWSLFLVLFLFSSNVFGMGSYVNKLGQRRSRRLQQKAVKQEQRLNSSREITEASRSLALKSKRNICKQNIIKNVLNQHFDDINKADNEGWTFFAYCIKKWIYRYCKLSIG